MAVSKASHYLPASLAQVVRDPPLQEIVRRKASSSLHASSALGSHVVPDPPPHEMVKSIKIFSALRAKVKSQKFLRASREIRSQKFLRANHFKSMTLLDLNFILGSTLWYHFLPKTEGPSSDEWIVEEVACENSGLRRSSISDTYFVRKIVKIWTVGDRGSGAH